MADDMADDFERRRTRLAHLRKLGLQRGVEHLPTAREPRFAPGAGGSSFAGTSPGDGVLPGQVVDTPFGPAWLREERYPLRLYPDLAEWLEVEPASLAALDRNAGLLGLVPAQTAFIDTETTGLSLGVGTYTFLVGVGGYEPPAAVSRAGAFSANGDERGDLLDDWSFVVRQFFMRNPGEERAQLHLLENCLLSAAGVVTFNGRAFDLPLINNRFVLNEMPLPLVGAAHLDLLPPARRLYRAHWGSCTLGQLEKNILALQRSADDVPGYLIPDIYQQYYRTGEATEMLARVFYHNLQDVVSMALLGARMARYFPAEQAAGGRTERLARLVQELHPLECVSLGRCYDSLQWEEEVVLVYRAALAVATSAQDQATVLRELAYTYKRRADRAAAAALWEEWVSSVPGEDITPYVELAKYHEWHTRDLAAARGWAAWALSIAQRWPPGFERDAVSIELQHRLARIEAKMGGRAGQNEPVDDGW